MPRDNRVIDLLESWMDREARGEAVDPKELCQHCPDLIPEVLRLHRFEATIRRMLSSATSLDTVGTAETLPPPSDKPKPTVQGYEINHLLAAGGMGEVYRARQIGLDREVALKVIRPDKLSPNLRARFQTEARAVAQLDHPNIVHVYEVGECEPAEGGAPVPFLALEFVPGGTLEARAGEKPLAWVEAARLVWILARAMAHAHARGIVHRDLKPDNVLVGPPSEEASLNATIDGVAWRPRITDFGLARQEGAGATMTLPGSVLGTPAYMAPEQAEGLAAGPPADVYALGAILYRLLSGHPVFQSASLTELLYQVCHTPPRSLREQVPDVPPVLEALCLRCLSKKAEDRPTAAELAEQLAPFTTAGPLTTTVEYPVPRPGGLAALLRHRRLAIALGLLVCLAIVGGGLLGWRLLSAPKPVVEPEPVAPLKGYLDAMMTRPKDPIRQGLRMNDPGARPMRPGDEVRVLIDLNRPAYAYLIWVDTDGKVTPMYPWIDGDWKRRSPEEKAAKFRLPQLNGRWGHWPMGPGKAGLETMVVLCRDEPLPEEVDVGQMLGEFGRQSLAGQLPGAVAWFENGVTVTDEPQRAPLTKAVEGGNPLERVNREIQRRVKGHFSYTRAITYVNEGDGK
jgi:serine/threonine protein kinase